MPNSLEHIQTQKVTTTNVNSINFTGLSATYKTFVVKAYWSSNSNSTSAFYNNDLNIKINSTNNNNQWDKALAVHYGVATGGTKFYQAAQSGTEMRISGPREKYNSDVTYSWAATELEILPSSGNSQDEHSTVIFHTGFRNGIRDDVVNQIGTFRRNSSDSVTSISFSWNSTSAYYLVNSCISIYGIKES